MSPALSITFEERLRRVFGEVLSYGEVLLYIALGIILLAGAFVGIAGACALFVAACKDWTHTTQVFELIDRLLFVLMMVEILHTVRISLRWHKLVVEPFLIVGLIAIIRRILVIAMQAEAITSNWTEGGKMQFQAAMVELSVLSVVIAVLVGAICIMRRHRTPPGEESLGE
jgi:hypothetical protein